MQPSQRTDPQAKCNLEKESTQSCRSDYVQSAAYTPSTAPKSTPDFRSSQETVVVEPKSSEASPNDDRMKAKKQVEDVVDRLMKNPNDPSKAGLVADDILAIIIRVREALMLDAALIELEPPIIIVGDIHGQFSDAIAIFEQNGNPPSSRYLFLGDYIDRGEHSTETVILFFGLKLLYPDSIFLLRGNHECKPINRVYGFYEEVVSRFDIELWEQFQLTFNCFPICARISNRIFCMHGGLSRDLNSWQMFTDVRRPIEIPTYGVLCDLLWSDPTNENVQFGPSARGISSTFGEEYVIQFCKDMGLDIVVRAHQVVLDGYELFAGRRMITIFSAPYYCKEFSNSSAVLIVGKDLECRVNVRLPKGIIEENANEEEGPSDPAQPPPTNAVSPPPPNEQPKAAEPTSPKPKSLTPKKEGTPPLSSSPKTTPSSPATTLTSKTSATSPTTASSPATTPKKYFDDVSVPLSDDESVKKTKTSQKSSGESSSKKSKGGSSEKASSRKNSSNEKSDPVRSNAPSSLEDSTKKIRPIGDNKSIRKTKGSKANPKTATSPDDPDASVKTKKKRPTKAQTDAFLQLKAAALASEKKSPTVQSPKLAKPASKSTEKTTASPTSAPSTRQSKKRKK